MNESGSAARRWRWNGLWRKGAGTPDDPNNGRLILRLTGLGAGEFPCGPACDTEKGCVRADQLHADELHVVPVNDLVGHEDGEDCVCGPDTTFVEGGKVITHHSLDGREEREQDAT